MSETETKLSNQVVEPVTTKITLGAETKLSNEVVEPMTKDVGAENPAPAETKPGSDEAAKAEDVKVAACYACCLAGAAVFVCLPCYIIGVALRCLLLPCTCARLCCCPSEDGLPVTRHAA